MAMIDYGAVVKKNGKIISNTEDLFQNFTGLADEDTGVYNDDDEYMLMSDNYMALIGNSKVMVGFYKTFFRVAINKHFLDLEDFWEYTENHIKPYHIEGVDFNITVKPIGPEWNPWNKCIARVFIDNDEYSVLFGYGIDVNPEYCYGRKSYFHPHPYGATHWTSYVYKDMRKCFRKVKEWYGLSE